MTTRNPSQLLIDKHIEAGYDSIQPSACVRFIQPLLEQMPEDWQNLNHDSLIKKIRMHCEQSTATGKLKRKRFQNISGYVYFIVNK